MSTKSQTVHVIDDDEAVRDSLAELFSCEGMKVATYPSAVTFLEAAPSVEGDCIVTDVEMPAMNGLQLLGRLREMGVTAPVIVMTGRPNRAVEEAAWAHGAVFLSKPIDEEAILDTVRSGLAGTAIHQPQQV